MTDALPAPDLRALAPRLAGALVALDFDGTLAPIVRDPEASRAVPGAVAALQSLAGRGAQISVVTGREAAVVVRLGGLDAVPGLTVDGVYGAQRLRGGRLEALPTPPAMAAARAEVDAVLAAAGADPAVWVEDKDVSFVVHTRLAPAPEEAFDVVQGPVSALAQRHGLEVHPGKQVLEVRVPGVDKGGALDALLADVDPPALLWAGDDLGDIPAFDALRAWRERTGRPAVGIAVRPGPSPDPLGGDDDSGGLDPRVAVAADAGVDGPEALVAALTALASSAEE